MKDSINDQKFLYLDFKEALKLLEEKDRLNSNFDGQINTNISNYFELDNNLILVYPQYSHGIPLEQRKMILFKDKKLFIEYCNKDVWDDKIYNEWEYFRDDFYQRKHLNREFFWDALNKKDKYFKTETEFLDIESRQFSKFIKRQPENYIYLYLKLLESMNDTLKMEWGLEKCYSALNVYYVPIFFNKKNNIIINYHDISSMAMDMFGDWKIQKVIQEKLKIIEYSYIDLNWYTEVEVGIFKRDQSKVPIKNGSLNDDYDN